MLRIFYGAAGSGKTAAAMEEIRSGAGTGDSYILLVPEQYSHEAERELCRCCGDGLSLYGEVLSFTGLARSISAQTGENGRARLDNGGRLLCMALAADGLYSRLRVYGAARRRAQMQSILLDAVDEIKSSCVSAQQLLEASENAPGTLGDKLHDLSLVLEAYDAVVANGRADPSDRLSVLAEQIERADISEKTHIYVDGFTYFTAQEERVLQALILKRAQVTVCIGCDELHGSSEVFALGRMTARRLMAFAGENGIEHTAVRCTMPAQKHPALRFFAQELFSYKKVSFDGECGNISIVKTQSINDECEWAAARALELCRELGCRRRDIAIAVSGFDDYRLGLESAFERYGVPLYTARKADMMSKPLPTLVEAAYETVLGGWESEDVLDYLRTGFAGLDTAECDELENYVFMWQLHGSAWTQDKPWSLHPDGYGGKDTPEAAERLERINRLRERAARPLRAFARACENASTASQQAQALTGLFAQIGLAERLRERADGLVARGEGAKAQEYAQLWGIIVAALEQCVAILGDMPADAEFFGRLFTTMLTKYDIGTIPVSLDCVIAGEIDRMRRRNIRHLIVLGATDDRLPGVKPDTGVFSGDERKRLHEMNIDLGGTGEAELWLAFSQVYECLSLPSDSLSLCYSAMSAAGAQQHPSFVVNRAAALFSIKTQTPDMDRLRMNAEKPALLLAANALHGGGEYANAAAEYFAARAPERLAALKNAANMSRGSLSKDSVRALYGDKLYLSASRIDKFASCRFAYFMQYALRAKPHEPAMFTAPELGSFMHDILEKVCAAVKREGGFKSVDDEKLMSLTDEFVAAYIKDKLNDFREKSSRFEYLFRRLTANVRQVISDLADELRRSDFEPLSFELDFMKTPELPPVKLGSGEDELVLTGIADRVDGWMHEGKLYLRVVDYKTGRKKFDLSDVWYGMNLQMLLYLFSLGENGSALYGSEIVPAGVLYVPARAPVMSADAELSDSELEEKRTKELRRSGIILNEPAVIAAMEHSETPKYIPVEFKKSGAVGESLVTAERLGVLARHIDKTLCEMARQLRRGSIAADPYYAGQQETACINCDYFDACHFRDGENGETLRQTPHLPATKVWSKLEGGEENE